MTAIRGAITVRANIAEDITAASVRLIEAMREKNRATGIVSLIISSTKDITAKYPAAAVRESGLAEIPLFSCAEPDIDGALPLCIRMLMYVNDDITAKHVYLDGAACLRPDLKGV